MLKTIIDKAEENLVGKKIAGKKIESVIKTRKNASTRAKGSVARAKKVR